MRLGTKGMAFVERLYDEASVNPSLLTEWQQKFIEDFQDKIYSYGEDTFITEPQMDQLNKIADQLGFELLEEEHLDDSE